MDEVDNGSCSRFRPIKNRHRDWYRLYAQGVLVPASDRSKVQLIDHADLALLNLLLFASSTFINSLLHTCSYTRFNVIGRKKVFHGRNICKHCVLYRVWPLDKHWRHVWQATREVRKNTTLLYQKGISVWVWLHALSTISPNRPPIKPLGDARSHYIF
jgi:hypothetical protein